MTDKILVLSWYSPDRADAGELIRLAGITSRFDNHFEVCWAVVDAATVIKSPNAYNTGPDIAAARYRISGMDYLRATIRGWAIERHRLGRVRALRHWLRELLSREMPTVVWVNQPFVWSLIPPDWRSRVILDTHNVNSVRLGRIAASQRNPVVRAMLLAQVFLTRRFERMYSAQGVVVAVSDADASALPRSRGASIVVVPNGADLDREAVTRRLDGESSPRLLFLGSLSYSANIDALSQLIDWLAQNSDLDIRVTVAGSGDDGTAAQLCEGDQRITFVGRVQDARREMRAHHALIAPHRQGGGSRIKVLEAFASRLPVVGTTVAVEGLGVVPSTHYIACSDAISFRTAVLTLREVDVVDHITQQAWSLAQSHTWNSLSLRAAELTKLIDD